MYVEHELSVRFNFYLDADLFYAFQVGIYVANVKNLCLVTCATPVHIHYARDAVKMLTSWVCGEIKGFAQHAFELLWWLKILTKETTKQLVHNAYVWIDVSNICSKNILSKLY